MPYDPNWPQNGDFVDGNRFRDQFGGIHDLIPADGSVTDAQVDAVNPLPPGSAPAAAVSKVDSTLHFTFDLPVSISGVVVDSVSSVGPADPASASATLIGEVLHLSLSIPRGFDGANGAPGEVTNAALAAEIAGVVAGSSANSNGVGTLDTPFADPDAESLRGKLNELLLAMRR